MRRQMCERFFHKLHNKPYRDNMKSEPEKHLAGTSEKISALNERKMASAKGGGDKRIQQQHNRGKLTARERIELLLDTGTFTELDTLTAHTGTDFGMDKQVFEGDSVVTGFGDVNGQPICVYSQDFTVFGGSLSLAAGRKIAKLMDHASRVGTPIVGINDSGGARIQEGVDALTGYGEIFLRNTLLSGVVPQITVIAGPAAGGAVYSPALTDFIFMVEPIGQMYITGPDVIEAATGEKTTAHDLGGAAAHCQLSGVAHFSDSSEEECLNNVKLLLSYLPPNNTSQPPRLESSSYTDKPDENLRTLVPEHSKQPYDMMEVIRSIADYENFMPVHNAFAPNIIIGFMRMDGRTVGIVANQPLIMAGMLDIDASDKAARFVRFCDAFNIPLVTLVDVPGFMPGVQQEYSGIIRHGAKLIYAYAEATTPKLTVILRKAYGGAYIVMGSKHLRADINLAWPNAEIAVMGPEGAAEIIGRREIEAAEDKQAKRIEITDKYRERFANPYIAAQRGYVDDVIDPADTRRILIRGLRILQNKTDTTPARKHGNIPL